MYVTWNEVRWTDWEDGTRTLNHPKRISIFLHLLLRQLPRVIHLQAFRTVNVALLSMQCRSLNTLHIHDQDLRLCELVTLLRNNRLRTLRATISGGAPSDGIETLPIEACQLQDLRLTYDAIEPNEDSNYPHVAISLLRKLSQLQNLALTVYGNKGELFDVVQSIPKRLRTFSLHLYNESSPATMFHRPCTALAT